MNHFGKPCCSAFVLCFVWELTGKSKEYKSANITFWFQYTHTVKRPHAYTHTKTHKVNCHCHQWSLMVRERNSPAHCRQLSAHINLSLIPCWPSLEALCLCHYLPIWWELTPLTADIRHYALCMCACILALGGGSWMCTSTHYYFCKLLRFVSVCECTE